MNPVLEVPVFKAEPIELGRDSFGIVRKANGNPPHLFSPIPLRLKARARTIGIRRDDLARMHWRKVWRSMCDD